MKVGNFKEFTRKTAVEYPSGISVTEFYIVDETNNNTVIFIDDLNFASKKNTLDKYTKEAKKEAIKLFLKEIKKPNAKTVEQCENIMDEIIDKKIIEAHQKRKQEVAK